MNKYRLFIWRESPERPGFPCEYSSESQIIEAADDESAEEEARKRAATSPKWELYAGNDGSASIIKLPIASFTRPLVLSNWPLLSTESK